MIEFRQKQFGFRKKIVDITATALGKSDLIKSRLNKLSVRSGAKTIARDLEKSNISKKTPEIIEKYKNNPKIAERKIHKLKRLSKGRVEASKRTAEKKLAALTKPQTRTKEQVLKDAESIVPKNPTEVYNKAKQSLVGVGKGVASGLNKLYNNTGAVLTKGGEALTKATGETLAFLSGDVVNAVGPALGHPEVLTVPVGTIGAGAVAAAKRAVLPRSYMRGRRQAGIKLRKAAERSGFHSWSLGGSLKRSINESSQYSRHLGTAGHISYV